MWFEAKAGKDHIIRRTQNAKSSNTAALQHKLKNTYFRQFPFSKIQRSRIFLRTSAEQVLESIIWSVWNGYTEYHRAKKNVITSYSIHYTKLYDGRYIHKLMVWPDCRSRGSKFSCFFRMHHNQPARWLNRRTICMWSPAWRRNNNLLCRLQCRHSYNFV